MNAVAEVTINWIQSCVPPFDDANFYEPGAVADVRLDDRSIQIDCEGVRCLEHTDGRSLRGPGDFRREFPDGELPGDGDGWTWVNNSWFDLYEDSDHLDRVCISLREAIGECRRILAGEG